MKNRMVKKAIFALLLILSLLFISFGGCSGEPANGGEQTFEVKRGGLDVIVSADGSLNMPNTYNLSFGTAGTFLDIQMTAVNAGDGWILMFGTMSTSTGKDQGKPLVQEGDKVKDGAILAFLDNTAQKNAIRTALFSMQTTINSIPTSRCPPISDLPNSYPELSAVRMFEDAQKDLAEFVSYYNQGQYKDAGFKLAMTYFDIEVCEDLLKSRPNAAALAGARTNLNSNTIYYPDGTAGTQEDISSSDAINYLEDLRDKLLSAWSVIRGAGQRGFTTPEMLAKALDKAQHDLDTFQQDMVKGRQLVENTVHLKGRDYLTYPDIPTSRNFLQSSLRSLQELEKYEAQADAKAEEIAKKIYLAKFNLSIGSDVLQNQTLTYDWISASDWQTLQKYNLDVQSAEMSFRQAKQDIMNTVIIAPADGEVVSVNLKQGAVLSTQDYASRAAIQLVDTQKIKFTGMVDEIDIMKVKTGQRAEIAVDAITDKKFTGTVKFISPFGVQSGQVIKFAVTIELDTTDVAELRGGLTATADINTYSAKDVLLVPTTAIMTTPMGAMVTVVNEATGQPEPRKVTLGKQNFQYAEVLEGLKEGEKILLSNQPVIPGQLPGAPVQSGSMRTITR